MEENTSMMAKKMWNLMRVAFFLLKKGICKRKILMDLNLVMKRGKNLMFHHHHHQNQSQGLDSGVSTVGQSAPRGEYEFSCSDTPLYRHYFTNYKRKNHHHNKNYFMPSPFEGMDSIEDMNNIFDIMMYSSTEDGMSSPVLSGLSPSTRQLRITDSPFLVQNNEDCNNKHVDAAAEDFINKFYSQLKNQN